MWRLWKQWTAFRVRFEGQLRSLWACSQRSPMLTASSWSRRSRRRTAARNTVRLDVAVEGKGEDVAAAVASIRDGLPAGASLEIVEH
jgi:hypothetical protein